MSKNKGGRPRKEFTEEMVRTLENLCKIQCTQSECAATLEVSIPTMDTRLKEMGYSGFLEFHQKHSENGKSSLRRAQWKAALDGNPTMLIWMGKQVLGQKDRQESVVEHRFESMTDDELNDAIERRLAKLAKIGSPGTRPIH